MITTRRKEIRFIVDNGDLNRIKGIITGNLRKEHYLNSHNGGLNLTVYLDRPDSYFYRSHAAMEPGRIKMRIRQYPKKVLMEMSPFSWLELKSHGNKGITHKERTLLPTDILASLFLEPENYTHGEYHEFAAFILKHGLSPASVTAYSRSAFVNADTSIKVTLDRDIQYFRPPAALQDLFQKRFDLQWCGNDPSTIVEIKLIENIEIPGFIKEIYNMAKPIEQSKFIKSVDAVNSAVEQAQ